MKIHGTNVVGFSLSVHYNGTRMFLQDDPNDIRCPHCKHRASQSVYNSKYRIDRKPPSVYLCLPDGQSLPMLDLAVTYDGQDIASSAFKAFCKRKAYHGIKFKPFPSCPDFFQFIVGPVIEFDPDRKKTRFLNQCKICGEFEEIIGATPAFVRRRDPISDGFWRTDLCFGTLDGKSPLILVGAETKAKLKGAFKHISFREVYGLE